MIVSVNCNVCQDHTYHTVWSNSIDSTRIPQYTEQVSSNSQSTVVAVIVHSQYQTYVTNQELLTVATEVSELCQFKSISDAAADGVVTGFNWNVELGAISTLWVSNSNILTLTIQDTTQVAVYHQSIVVAVIVAVHQLTYHTVHSSLTVATLVSELVHTIPVLLGWNGDNVACSHQNFHS